MNLDDHTPSITHLREFARARHSGRKTHVAQDRQQVTAPRDSRFFAFVYEKLITAVVKYIRAGCRGRALEKATEETSDRMRPSYSAAARGLKEVLNALAPVAVERRQRNILVVDEDGVGLVGIRIPLVLEMKDGRRVAAIIYFSEKALTAPELKILDTALALAAQQISPDAAPAILMARGGEVRWVSRDATNPDRVAFVRRESIAYRVEWAAAS